MPKKAYVSGVVTSKHNANTIYVAFDNHENDDYKSYIYASVDGGSNFRSINEGLPAGHTVTTVTEDPKNPSVLYVGTEFGLFVSVDNGGRWQRVRSGLPTVPIHEIVFHPRDNDMILATHGRSLWILDDATPIQQAAEAMRTDAFLFDIRQAMQMNLAQDRGFVTDKPFRGENPTPGAAISYYLKGAAPQVTYASATPPARWCANSPATRSGTRAMPGSTACIGICATSRSQAGPPGWQGGGGGGGGQGGAPGPFVMPGDYRVTLLVGDKEIATKPVKVIGDIAIPMTDTDRRTLHDTTLALHRLHESANEAAATVTQLARNFNPSRACSRPRPEHLPQ